MEQQNQNKNNNNNNQPKMPRFNMGWIYGLIIFTLLMLFFTDGGNSLTSAAAGSARQEATYTKFKEYVSKGYAQKVEVNTSEKKLKMFVKSKNIRDVFQQTAQQTGPEPFVSVQYGSPDELDKYLTEVQQKGLLVDFSYNNKTSSVLENFLYSVGPLLLFFVLMYFLFNRMGSGMGGGGGIFNVGKSKAKMYEKGNDLGITFKDVAGQAGAKQEVQEIVEFLKNPKKYTDLG
jgi:cell division protease FtsH